MVLRYSYLLRASRLRILDMIYWPALQLLTWGFLQTYLVKAGALNAPGGGAQAAGTLIGAILLWDIMLRGQQGFCFSFIEEMWSRNLPNILMSPLRPIEFIASLIIMSLIRLLIGVMPVTLLAIIFFGFNLWKFWRRLWGLLYCFNRIFLEHRPIRLRPIAQTWRGSGKSDLVIDVFGATFRCCLLPRKRASNMATAHFLDAAARICV